MLPREIGGLLEDLQKRFRIKEVSLETNPNHLTDEIVTILKDGGVNRLSVGVQSFQDDLLKQMERYHKYGSGLQIQERLAKYAGTFDTLNVDMIFNFPISDRFNVGKGFGGYQGYPGRSGNFLSSYGLGHYPHGTRKEIRSDKLSSGKGFL